jgi:ribosomal protein S12 methylthiotransferase accessory factor
MIERDSHAEWLDRSLEERLSTKVDPASVSDPECQMILQRFEAARLDVAIWDMTSHACGIPVYSVQILDRDEGSLWRRLGVCPGRGCHLSPAVALSRALCEAAQARLTIISGSRDDNPFIPGNRKELLFAVWHLSISLHRQLRRSIRFRPGNGRFR